MDIIEGRKGISKVKWPDPEGVWDKETFIQTISAALRNLERRVTVDNLRIWGVGRHLAGLVNTKGPTGWLDQSLRAHRLIV